jgi:hypothetical protein
VCTIPHQHLVVFDTIARDGQGDLSPQWEGRQTVPEISHQKILRSGFLSVEERANHRDLSRDHRSRMTDSDYFGCWAEDQVGS